MVHGEGRAGYGYHAYYIHPTCMVYTVYIYIKYMVCGWVGTMHARYMYHTYTIHIYKMLAMGGRVGHPCMVHTSYMYPVYVWYV